MRRNNSEAMKYNWSNPKFRHMMMESGLGRPVSQWADEEIAELRRLVSHTPPIGWKHIADRIGVCAETARRKAAELGLSKPPASWDPRGTKQLVFRAKTYPQTCG